MKNPRDKRVPALISADTRNGDILMYYHGYLKSTGINITAINKFITQFNVLVNNPIVINNNYTSKYSGTPYIIPTGETIIVDNNKQYLVKDHLYLTGGHIILSGNAQLKII